MNKKGWVAGVASFLAAASVAVGTAWSNYCSLPEDGIVRHTVRSFVSDEYIKNNFCKEK